MGVERLPPDPGPAGSDADVHFHIDDAGVSRADLRGLTSLRAVAAAVVLLHHVADAAGLPFGLGALGGLGFVGVDFFFVLSGFVLTWSHRDGRGTTTFLRHRLVRVYPLHVVGWALAIGVAWFTGVDYYPVVAWVLALVLLQVWAPSGHWAYAGNGVSWSLACEAFFYALFPWLRPRIARLAPRGLWTVGVTVLLLMTAAVVALRVWNPSMDVGNPGVLYTDPLYRLGEFVLGIVLARLTVAGRHLRCPAGVALLLALVVYALAALAFARLGLKSANPAAVREIGGLLLLPAIVLVLAATVAAELDGRLPRWLSSRTAVRLGRWSFAFYVVHQLVVNTVVTVVPTATAAGQVAVLAVAAVVSTLLAAGLHHGVEVPLARRWRATPPLTPA